MLRPYYSDDRRVKRVRAKVTARLIPSRVSRPARQTATFISAVLLNRNCRKVFAPARFANWYSANSYNSFQWFTTHSVSLRDNNRKYVRTGTLEGREDTWRTREDELTNRARICRRNSRIVDEIGSHRSILRGLKP